MVDFSSLSGWHIVIIVLVVIGYFIVASKRKR